MVSKRWNEDSFRRRDIGGLELDSVVTLEIIVGLEEEFGIEVRDEDLRVELFDSVKALADYVRQQKGT